MKTLNNKEKQAIMDEAHERFRIVHDYNFDLRETFKKNMKFSFNIAEGQWDYNDIKERDESNRPYLTFNKLGKFVAQVVNQEKGTPDTDDIIPVDDKGDSEIAAIYNELIQDIHYQSSIEDIYGIACKHAVGGGYGYWRYVAEYTDCGFDQEIKAKPIKNPLNVDIDPRGQFAFIREGVPMREFEKMYPKANKSDFTESEDEELWYEEDKVFIAEYFRKVPIKKTIVEVVVKDDETAIYEITEENESEIRKMQITRERKADSHKIEWFKITGHEILDYKDWPGKHIPIVEIVGDEIDLEGYTYKKALTSDAQDPQKMYNYWATSLTEKVALTPKAPYLLTPEQIKGFELMWEDANVKNYPYLLYKQTGSGMPQRALPPPIDTGALTMLQLANSDIMDVPGRYEAAAGAASNERSGRAIDARNARSDLTAFTFTDNFRKAKIQAKRILIDLMPKIYDNERVVRLRNEDTTIEINKQIIEDGKEIILHDLSRGRYDVRAQSFTNPSKRQQIVATIERALQYAGELYAPILLPLLFKYSDAPGAKEIGEAIANIPPPAPKGEEKANPFQEFM